MTFFKSNSSPNSREIRRHSTKVQIVCCRTLQFKCTTFSNFDAKNKNFLFITVHMNRRYYENSVNKIQQLFDP